MPGRKRHQVAGAVTGAARVAYQSWGTPDCVMEMIGGGCGGYLSSMLPDFLEPAISSWHRGTCHSVSAGGVVLAIDKLLVQWADYCREQANKYRAIQTVQDPVSGETKPVVPFTFCQQLAQLFWSFLAGVLNGLVPGYISHLALDAGTPRGIPFFGAG